jgi:hypothetical protein
MLRPVLRHALLASSALGAIACSSGELPPDVTWINAGLSVTLQNNVAVAGHGVMASLQNNTGARIEFGPPACGTIEAFVDGEWRTARTAVACAAVVLSLDNGKAFPFGFSVPADPGIYRIVTSAVTASDQVLTVRSEAVIVR